MERARALMAKYREQIAYLFFGGVTTAVNFAAYALLHAALGMASDPANLIAWAASVLTAYLTNRRWVFQSQARGFGPIVRELGSFVAARVLTGLLDMGIMHVAVEVIGPRWVPGDLRRLWDMGVKLASNVLVIILNYVFSKRFIFRERDGR